MKFSDYVKVMLMDSVHELIADPGRFARSPGRDFSRNRKIGIRDLLLIVQKSCLRINIPLLPATALLPIFSEIPMARIRSMNQMTNQKRDTARST